MHNSGIDNCVIVGFWICVIILLLVLLVVIMRKHFKRYENGERNAGNVLMELQISKRVRLLRKLDGVAAIAIVLFFFLKDRIMNNVVDVNAIVWLGMIAAVIILENKPQKICENGILVQSGLVAWDKIKEIKPVDEKDDVIKIKLRKSMRSFNRMRLYCMPGQAPNVVRIIESKMNREIM